MKTRMHGVYALGNVEHLPRVKKVLYNEGNVVCAMALDVTNTRNVGAKMLMMPPIRNIAIFRKKTGLLPIL